FWGHCTYISAFCRIAFHSVFFPRTLPLAESLLYSHVSLRLHLRGVGHQGLNLGGKLLHFLDLRGGLSVSFRFHLRRVANLARRLKVGENRAGARCGFFLFGQCFLSFI